MRHAVSDRSHRLVRAVVGIWLAAATAASAQSAGPRNGDVRDGRDYQPTEAEVARRERAAGVPDDRSETDTVERMYDKMMRREHEEIGTPLPPNTPYIR